VVDDESSDFEESDISDDDLGANYIEVAQLGSGLSFGELALVSNKPR
jgi:hypothetical protein